METSASIWTGLVMF